MRRKLGAGSFGEIYRGEDRETGELVAIKLESLKTKFPQLSYESKLYTFFARGIGIPRLYWFGAEPGYNVMVISLLGKSLEDLASQYHHRFSLKTVLMLADQMLSCIEWIHSKNFIHRDIKPDNFVMGTGQSSNQVFLIDFGLAKKYQDSKAHIAYVEGKDLTGTARYASVSALKGCEQSRRDDLEALGYVWVYLLKGTLPWMGLEAKNRKQKYERIYDVKLNTSFEALCSGLPDEFVQYFHSVRRLRFPEQPEYANYRKMFRKLFQSLGYLYDYAYDWSQRPASKRPNNQDESDYLSDCAKRPKPPQMRPQKHSSSKQDSTDPGLFSNMPHFSIAVHPSNRGKPSKVQTDVDPMRLKVPIPRDSDDSDGIEVSQPQERKSPQKLRQTEVEVHRKFAVPKPAIDDLPSKDVGRRRVKWNTHTHKPSDDSEYEDFTDFHKDVPKRIETDVDFKARAMPKPGRQSVEVPIKKKAVQPGRHTLGTRTKIPEWMNDKLRGARK
jgi:serine/threonine protein kinase